jgi:isopentenyl diphosphate isomerase/L-lactate dehydrogenase-like FMN-dependent dehydrogenase
MTVREGTGSPERAWARRAFLRFLAASPLAAWAAHADGPSQLSGAPPFALGHVPAASSGGLRQAETVIASIDQALNVLDFEAVARQKLPPAHFGYLATGTDDDATVRANREAFSRYQLRVRRLVDVERVDTSVTLFGVKYDTPIVLAPVSSQKAFHAEGELAVARAARATRHLQILSTVSSTAVEPVNEARGEPVWYQLYPTDDWAVTEALVARAEKAGCPVLVLTVDNVGNNRETVERFKRQDTRPCKTCHTLPWDRSQLYRPMFAGLDVSKATRLTPHVWTWDFVCRIKDRTRMKLVLKGLVTREDAQMAVERGVDGIVVSNHGGRAENSQRGAIECLREVVEGAGAKVPVLVDSGFRRGTDIFKALALGATAVCIGRPYVWGLAGFGQPGVEAVLGILRRELELVMRQAGTPAIARIGPDYVVDRGRW